MENRDEDNHQQLDTEGLEKQLASEGQVSPDDLIDTEQPTASDYEPAGDVQQASDDAGASDGEGEAGDDGGPEDPEADGADAEATGDPQLDDNTRNRGNLRRYVTEMDPRNPLNASQGARMQLLLWRSIQTALRQQGSEFTRYMDQLVAYVATYRTTVFNERFAFRFTDQMSLPREQRQSFERILSVLLKLSNVSSKGQAMKQVDLGAVTRFMRDEGMKQRLEAYLTNG